MLKRVHKGKHLEVILKKMCEFVEVDFDSVDFSKQDWADSHEWSYEKEKEFQEWLYEYFVANKDCVLAISDFRANQEISTKELKQLVLEFTVLYGWAISEDTNFLLENIYENKPKRKTK